MDLKKLFSVVACMFLSWGGQLAAEGTGSLEGRVLKDGKGLGGVAVVVFETKATEISDADGRFAFAELPVGNYNVVFSVGSNVLTRPDVRVEEQATTRLDVEVDWDVAAYEVVTVYSASRRMEKILDAPAAVSVVSTKQIEEQSSHGQLPKLLEFTPGAEVTQSGLYDFNFNTRGFNSSVNRRVAVYLDGRDTAAPFLGAQEWAALSSPLDDLASVEFIRGPSAALYGANASAGVINMTSKTPRDSLGGTVRTTAGELSTRNFDARWATSLGRDWYFKAALGVRDTDDFRVSRSGVCSGGPNDGEPCSSEAACEPGTCIEPTLEYSRPCRRATEVEIKRCSLSPSTPCDTTCPAGLGVCQTIPADPTDELLNPDLRETPCLPYEAIPLVQEDNQIVVGSIRFDKYLSDDSLITIEGGSGNIDGPVFQTGIGRIATVDSERPWARIAHSRPHWNILGYYARRDAQQQSLQSAADLFTDSEKFSIEFQTNWDLADGKGRVVAGGAHTDEEIDTADTAGRQTLLRDPVDSDRQAAFAQFDWRFNDHIKTVFAGRVDWNTLHDTQFSPKAALVYNLNRNHTLRFTYNEAFQVANYSEFFLAAEVTQSDGLAFVEPTCSTFAPEGECGFDIVPVLAVGNVDLVLEETQAWEVGYSAVLGRKAFLSIDYYNSQNENFISDLLPQVGPLGSTPDSPLNPNVSSYVVPAEWEDIIVFGALTLADAVRNALNLAAPTLEANGVQLSNAPDGRPIIVARSYINAGEVDTQGVDVLLSYFISKALSLTFSASWFDFEPQGDDPELVELLQANTPEYKVKFGLNYTTDRWSIGFSGRWVDDFRWSAGLFDGPVSSNPAGSSSSSSYSTVDIVGSYKFNDHWRLGINVANAFDDESYQAFGGDILARRALTHLQLDW